MPVAVVCVCVLHSFIFGRCCFCLYCFPSYFSEKMVFQSQGEVGAEEWTSSFYWYVGFTVQLRGRALVVFVRASCNLFQLRACMLAVVC